MSTDFTGSNKSISKESLYLMSADKLGSMLGVSRDKMHDFYKRIGKCSCSAEWGYYDRYTKTVNSNTYTSSALDDILILSASVGKEELLSKDVETAESRKAFIKNECSGLIEHGLCNDFELTGCFPHLDTPDQINSIVIDGDIKCIIDDNPFGTVHAKIGYTDSCGAGTVEPVPYYPLSTSVENLFEKDTIEDPLYNLSGVEYLWSIENSGNVEISEATSSMTLDHFDAATRSTAVDTAIRISLSYTEN